MGEGESEEGGRDELRSSNYRIQLLLFISKINNTYVSFFGIISSFSIW